MLTFSGGMLQGTERDCFGKQMMLCKHIEDILPILEMESTEMKQSAGCLAAC